MSQPENYKIEFNVSDEVAAKEALKFALVTLGKDMLIGTAVSLTALLIIMAVNHFGII